MLYKVSLAALLLSALAPLAFAQSISITDDTFIDSSAVGSISNGIDTQSYGADQKVKVVSSAQASANSAASISYTHTLFHLPSSVIAAFSTGLVTDVTVNYIPFNDSLGTYGTNPMDNDYIMQLHPLSHSFTTGNGQQTDPNTGNTDYSTTGGATWQTYDGNVTHTWASAGGDYDSVSVPDTNGTNLPASSGAKVSSAAFVWDITSLMSVVASQSDLETNGGLIRLPNEPVSDFQKNTINSKTGLAGIQDFTSLNSAEAPINQPYIQLTYAPEPATLGLVALGLPLIGRRARTCGRRAAL